MKHRHLLLLFLLLAAFGCRHGSRVETLQDRMPAFAEVYSLKDYHPDSAFRIMHRIEDTLDVARLQRLSPFLFNEYQVLHTELRYKNIFPISDDTLTLRAFAFYDSVVSHSRSAAHDKVLFYQFARSLYYKAAVESQRDQKAEAFADYLQALRAIDGLARNRQPFHLGHPNPEYMHFTALIYDRLAWFFYTYDQWEEALECLNLSNACFEKEDCHEGLASNYALMGDVMLAQGDRLVSLNYYEMSDSIYRTLGSGDRFHRHNQLFHQALSLSNQNRKEECKNVLNQALLETEEASRLARQIHFVLGYVYIDSQEPDSALYHFEQSHPLLPRQTLKTYCNTIALANALGDSIKAAHYGQMLADITLQQFYQKTEVAKMMSMFIEYKEEKGAAIGRNMLLYIVGFIVLLAGVIAVQSLWIHRRSQRSKADQEQHERIKSLLEKQIAQTNAEARQKEEKIAALQQELEKTVANPSFQRLPLSEKMEVLTQMPICKRALKVLDYNVKAGVAYDELVMSDSQLGQLIKAVDTVFPKFSVRIIEQYPRLNRSDVMYCCLYILGINEIQAAALTGKTYQAVWKRSTKLHEIFGNKSDLSFVINDILKTW